MTDSVEIHDGTGHIVLHVDTPAGAAVGRCLIVPPYGVPAHALGFLADALTSRGVESLRLDPRDHAGRGSGRMIDFRLSSLAHDIAHAIELYRPTCVAALSMGARAAMRALRITESSASAILLIPVVDARSTIHAIVGFDWFAIPDDRLPAVAQVLDISIHASRFLRDSESHRLVDSSDTIDDLLHTMGDVVLVPGTADPWVDVETVLGLGSLAPGRIRVRPVVSDRHRFDEDPRLAVRFIDVLVDEVERAHHFVGRVPVPLPHDVGR